MAHAWTWLFIYSVRDPILLLRRVQVRPAHHFYCCESPTQRDQYDDILVMVDCTSWSNPYPWLPALHLSLRFETSRVRWGFGPPNTRKKNLAAACPHRAIDWIGAPTSYTLAKRCDWKRSIPLDSFVSLFPLTKRTKRMNRFFGSPLPIWLQIQFSKDRNCRCFRQSISLPGSTLGLHDWKVFLLGWCWSSWILLILDTGNTVSFYRFLFCN